MASHKSLKDPPKNDEASVYRGFVGKWLKRLELSTFCMATRPVGAPGGFRFT
jgi:hypothetical protein